MKITTNRLALAAALHNVGMFTGGLADPPSIRGVLLTADTDSLTIVATDRHSMAVQTLPVEDGEPGLVFIETAHALQIVKAIADKGFDPQVELLAGSVGEDTVVNYPNGTLRFRIDHDPTGYPKWERVMPAADDTTDTTVIGLNPHLLARFTKVRGADNKTVKAPYLRCEMRGELSAMRVTVRQVLDFTAAVMPVTVAS